MTALAMLAAMLLDAALGEPRRAHPLAAFGRLGSAIERRFNKDTRWLGALALLLAVAPIGLTSLAVLQGLGRWPALRFATGTGLLYLAIGHRSLHEHARAVSQALADNDLAQARQRVARLVSRDCGELDEADIAAATVESVLENGSDAVFGALFWFAVAGAPGAVVYRLVNTLDAMWGYRTPRFRRFGWAAARLDDLLNAAPARLTALGYALAAQSAEALRCWRRQAPAWDSPNGGPVMAAGAGALGLRLGGPARYHGRLKPRPLLGCGAPACATDIGRSLALLRRSVAIWLVGIAAAGLAAGAAHA